MKIFGSDLNNVPVNDDYGIIHNNGNYLIYRNGCVWAADQKMGMPHKNIKSVAIQANGVTTVASSVTSVDGASVNGSITRFGVVDSPFGESGKCWVFRTHSSDADTAGTGAKRTEILPGSDSEAYSFNMGVSYTVQLKQCVSDWRSSNDQQIVWQLHGKDTLPNNKSPWLSLGYQGARRYIYLIYDTGSGNTGITLWEQFDYSPNTWEEWSISFRESQTDGFVKIYLNSQLIVNYNGPVGYQEPSGTGSYWKQGYYHWTTSSTPPNTWDSSVPLREVWCKGAYIFKQDGILPRSVDPSYW